MPTPRPAESITPITTQGYATQTKLATWKWERKWEKKHWLIVLAVACAGLWWISLQETKLPWLNQASELLSLIGGIALAGEAIIKLTQ